MQRVPSASLGEGALVRLCNLDVVQSVQRHGDLTERDSRQERLSKPCESALERTVVARIAPEVNAGPS